MERRVNCSRTSRAGLRFLLGTDVIVFLMVLEVITASNVTRCGALSPAGLSMAEQKYRAHPPAVPAMNDSISQNASALASCTGI